MNAELVLKTGSTQERFPLGAARVMIGRGVSAQIRIADAMASREHCAIEGQGAQFVLRDLGSANGTLVNGTAIGEHVLQWGDRIQVGDTVLVFLFDRPEEAGETLTEITAEPRAAERPPSFVLRSTEVNVTAASQAAFAPDYLALFHELATSLSIRSTVPEVCDGLVKALVRGRRFGRAAAVVLDPATGAPVERYTRLAQRNAPTRILIDGGELHEAWKTRSSFYRRAQKLETREFASMLVPLKGLEGTYGALYVDDLLAVGGLKESELHLVCALGQQVGLMLENIRYARRLQKERDTLQDMVASEIDIVGDGRAMARVLDLVRKVAPTESTVLVRGESGTGKELVVRAIHLNSLRRAGPLEIVNCATLTPALAESELFGHEKGAFTGAVARRKGRFEVAAGGTVFLDEVAELSPEAQAKLLRVLEQRTIRRVGGTEDVAVDVRILAATHRDLSERVVQGSFREDLFYRLNVLEIVIPPLRDRREDLVPLAEHFLRLFARRMGKRIQGFSPEALGLIRRHSWPGNVRELRNAVERAVLLASGEILSAADFPGLAGPVGPSSGPPATLEQMEREHILRVLASTGGNKSEAARILGVTRSTLYEKMQRYGMEG